MQTYTVYSNTDPEETAYIAAEIYFRWLQFALGKEQIGGRVLKHPSGRYAAAISWKKIGKNAFAIIADEEKAPEVGMIEQGHGEIDLKAKMLTDGKARRTKDGYLERIIPLRPDQWRPTPSLSLDSIVSAFGGEKLQPKLARVWAEPRPHVDPNSRFRVMSNRPGSAPWKIPAMPAYMPARHLAEEMQAQYGKGP